MKNPRGFVDLNKYGKSISGVLAGPPYPKLPEPEVRPFHYPVCCEKAKRIFCVCDQATSCPDHGNQHIGSHD